MIIHVSSKGIALTVTGSSLLVLVVYYRGQTERDLDE